MDTIYPKYKEFSEFHDEMRKKNSKECADKPRKIMYFILICIGITMVWISLLLVVGGSGGSSRRRYPSSRYRKVVKEGLFWDSVEYHER